MKNAFLKPLAFILIAFVFLSVFPLAPVGRANTETFETSNSDEVIPNWNFETFNTPPLFGDTPDKWYLSDDFNYDSVNKYIYSSTPDSFAKQTANLRAGIYGFSVSAQTSVSSAIILISAIGDDLRESRSFTVSTDVSSFSFYLFARKTENVTFQVEISSVTDNCEVKVHSVSVMHVGKNVLFTESGASVRTAADSTGLRFRGKVDKAFFDECITVLGSDNVETGIMIVPQDFLAEKNFTVDELGADAPLFIEAKIFNNNATANVDGYYGFNCAMTNVAPENTDRKFAARTYLKYVIDGTAYFAYANYDEAEHCRSVYEIAQRAKRDIDDGLITDSDAITAINDYLGKIHTATYEYSEEGSTEIFEKNDGKIYFFEFTTEKTVIMQITHDGEVSDLSVYANGTSVSAKSGYFLLPANAEIKICFNGKQLFSNVYTCPVKTVTVKLYSYGT